MIIPFIPNQDSHTTSRWLAAFSKVMPEYDFRLLSQMTKSERHAAEVAIVANPLDVDFAQLSNLKWVHSTWAGIENTLQNPTLQSIPVVRMQDPALAQTMAESVLCWVMNCQRNLPVYAQQQAKKVWQSHPVRCNSEFRVLLLGAGNLARCAGKLLNNYKYQVRYWSKTPGKQNAPEGEHFFGKEALPSAMQDSDVIVCLLPLTEQTRELLNVETLAWLPDDAYLLNFGRGGIVDEQALLSALDNGRLRHAVLDVFNTEPLPKSNPFWHHPQVTILPHITAPTNPNTASMIIADNLARYFDSGVIPEAVDRLRGY